jgi:hypothetical protein
MIFVITMCHLAHTHSFKLKCFLHKFLNIIRFDRLDSQKLLILFANSSYAFFGRQVPAAASGVSGLNSASQLLLSLREHENLARNSSLSSVSKVTAIWSGI